MESAEFWRLVATAAISATTAIGASMWRLGKSRCLDDCPFLKHQTDYNRRLDTLDRHSHDLRNRVMADVTSQIQEMRDEVTKLGIRVRGGKDHT